jgi:hypothetical protein
VLLLDADVVVLEEDPVKVTTEVMVEVIPEFVTTEVITEV